MYRNVFKASLLAALAIAAGCASVRASDAPVAQIGDVSETLTQRNARISSLEKELANRDARISSLEQRQTAPSEQDAASDLFPPNAKPGQCYARVLTPETYRKWEERVLSKEASERVEVIPARYETVKERVLVKEASKRLEVIPATYEMVSERVLVAPESTEVVEVPATYRTVTEQVIDKPAYTVWKKGPATQFGSSALSEKVGGTGEVMCLVEVPASYRTITKTVVDSPATTREIKKDAVYKTVQKRVVKTPAQTREVEIAAEYATIDVRKLVAPAQKKRIAIPAEYKTVARSEKTSDAKLDWQQVLCKVNATDENVRMLQAALQKNGYDVGPLDGVLGAKTIQSVNQFAARNGIPYGDNYVPMEVIKALDLRI